jgi:hypothetical protein
MGQRSLTNTGNVFYQEMATGDECDDGESHGFGFSLNNGFNCSLQTLNPFDRVSGNQGSVSLD